MMDRRETTPPAPPRFILFTPVFGERREIERFSSLLASVCDAADIAAVILRTNSKSDEEILSATYRLLPRTQAAGAAFLLENRAALAVKTGADGAHLADPETLQSALPLLKPARIAGAAGLFTRHDAMTVGEAGADYVMFGESTGKKRPALEAIVDRVGWWTEIFQIPCVAYASHLNEAAALADAGADFIALGDAIWSASEGPVGALRKAALDIRAERVR